MPTVLGNHEGSGIMWSAIEDKRQGKQYKVSRDMDATATSGSEATS